MCFDPVTLATIGTVAAIAGGVATVAGAGISAYSSVKAGEAKQRAAEAEAAQEKQLANYELQRGAEEERTSRQKTSQLLGRQRALLAASNIDISEGSPLNVLADTAQYGEQDAQNIRANARRTATGYRTQSDLTLAGGNDAASAGWLGALGVVTASAGTLADKWYDRGLRPAPVTGAW